MELINNQKMSVVVLGAGQAGTQVALQLASDGHHVTIFERNTMGSGSSSINPGRMGHGFHYSDEDTAKVHLRNTIDAYRMYPDFCRSRHRPLGHPLRYGRYMITKNSDISVDEMLSTYRAVQQEYARLCAEDHDNEIFGPPEKMWRIMERSEYKNDCNADLVALGVETHEEMFDIQLFYSEVRKWINQNPNVDMFEQHEVVNIEQGDKTGQNGTEVKHEFIITIYDKMSGSKKYVQTNIMINSTWYNIEKINSWLGVPYKKGTRTNRVKAIICLDLPDDLENLPSMFFCMGMFCMFTNLDNKRGIATYALHTNREVNTDIEVNENSIALLENGISMEEREQIGKKIFKGLCQYIPKLSKAKVTDVRFGVARTEGDTKSLQDLFDAQNPFHKRNYNGIKEHRIGKGLLVSNPATKLFYFVQNRQIVSQMVENFDKERKEKQKPDFNKLGA